MSMDLSGTGAGSAAQHMSVARLLTTFADAPARQLRATNILTDSSARTTDAVAKFSRSVRRSLHERFQNVFMQLTPRMKAKDVQLYMHSQRVLSQALRLLRVLDLSHEEVLSIGLAAYFHDIGKLFISDTLLNKTTALTPDEYAMIQQHSAFGIDLLSPYIPSQVDTLSFVYHHHERWDGRGYPCSLAGEATPLGARIIAIVDAFDAMTSERAYQAQRTPDEALEELIRCAGTQFDPLLVRLFLIAR